MTTSKILLLSCMATLALSACANTPSKPGPAVKIGEPILGALPAQKLERGSCGLFLWSRTAQPELVFFSDIASNDAQIVLNDKSLRLPRTGRGGDALYGQYDTQIYADGAVKLELSIGVDGNGGIVNGARVPTGTLRLVTDEGWTTVTPVAGMIACEPS